MKNKTVKTIKINPSDSDFTFNYGIYIISPEHIRTAYRKQKGIMGSELFYFEGNPTPLIKPVIPEGKNKTLKWTDLSGDYFNDVVDINFISQLYEPPSKVPSKFMNMIRAFFGNPAYIAGAIIALAVLYSIWVGGGI